MPPQGQIATWLAAQGCTKTAALVSVNGRLVRKSFQWNPNVPLESGARFRPAFKDRYGVDFDERRSPLEVETLVEAFNTLETFFAQRPDVFGLPAGYRLTDQDKTDLFYVLGPRNNLAIRELVLPAIANPPLPTTPTPSPSLRPTIPPATTIRPLPTPTPTPTPTPMRPPPTKPPFDIPSEATVLKQPRKRRDTPIESANQIDPVIDPPPCPRPPPAFEGPKALVDEVN